MTPSPRTTTLHAAFDQAVLGVDAVEGVTDGGGTRAFGNGDPAQCVDVLRAP